MTPARVRERPRTDRAASPPRFLRWLTAVGVLALTLRVAHTLLVLGSPLGDALVQDAWHYHEEALRILGVLPPADSGGVSFMNVGYPYFLAAAYLLRPAPSTMLWLQAVAGTAAALALALAARRLTGRDAAGALAGFLYAAYAGAIFYDGLLLTPALTNALLAVAILALATHRSTGRGLHLVVAGLAVGFAIVLRANLFLLVPALAPLAFFSRRPGNAGGRALAALLLAGSCLALPLSIVLDNGVRYGDWVPVSANGGMNFWVGNNRNAQGVYHAADFLAVHNAREESLGFLAEARLRTGDPDLTLARSSTFWLREGLDEIRSDPGRWLRIEWRKLALFWNGFEINTNVGMEFVRDFSPVLAWTPFRFGAIALLGVAGIAHLLLTEKRWAAWLASSLVLVPLVTCVAFFVSGEYRHPASLGLCLGSAAVLDAAWRLARGRATSSRSRAIVPAAAALLVLPLVLWRYPQVEAGCHPRYDYSNHARQLCSPDARGAPPAPDALRRAARLLDRARTNGETDLVLLETRFWVYYRTALVLEDPAAARRAVDAAGALHAEDLGRGLGRYTEASLRRIASSVPRRLGDLARRDFVRRDPELPRDLSLLGANDYREIDALLQDSRLDDALGFAREAVRAAPGHLPAQAQLGRVLLAAGREREGLSWLERSCNGWPENAECALFAAEHYASRGSLAQARAAALEAMRRDPGSPRVRDLLDRLSP